MSMETSGRSPSPVPVAAAFDVVRRHVIMWGPQLVVMVAILIDVALPERLTPFGPTWILASLEGALVLGLASMAPHPRWRHSPQRRRIALGLTALVSATNIVSLLLLVHYLLKPAHHHTVVNGHELIISGFGL